MKALRIILGVFCALVALFAGGCAILLGQMQSALGNHNHSLAAPTLFIVSLVAAGLSVWMFKKRRKYNWKDDRSSGE